MCWQPDFNAEQQHMDELLLKLLVNWYDLVRNCYDEEAENFDSSELIEQFCADVRETLIRLQDTPELKAAIGLKTQA
jgi:hypothetical protein